MAKDKIKGLQNLTEILLKKIKSEKISVDDMDTLLDILHFINTLKQFFFFIRTSETQIP